VFNQSKYNHNDQWFTSLEMIHNTKIAKRLITSNQK